MVDVQALVQVLVEVYGDGRESFVRRHGMMAWELEQELEALLLPRLSIYGPLWTQFKAQPYAMQAALTPLLQAILANDASLAAQVEAILPRLIASLRPPAAVDTGGGAFVQGAVSVQGGDFVGRDKVTVTGDGNIVGDHNVVTVTQTSGLDLDQLRALFETWRQEVAQRPDLPPVTKEDVQAELAEVETELSKGEKADEGFLMRRVRNIGRMAPDILEVMLTTFANPVAGLGKVAQKIAERAKAEAEGKA